MKTSGFHQCKGNFNSVQVIYYNTWLQYFFSSVGFESRLDASWIWAGRRSKISKTKEGRDKRFSPDHWLCGVWQPENGPRPFVVTLAAVIANFSICSVGTVGCSGRMNRAGCLYTAQTRLGVTKIYPPEPLWVAISNGENHLSLSFFVFEIFECLLCSRRRASRRLSRPMEEKNQWLKPRKVLHH